MKTKLKDIVAAKYFFALIMNMIVMMVMLLLFYARYWNDLDITMQGLLYGTSSLGIPMGHLVFSNIILGKVMAFLCKIPLIPWYTVFHYGLTFFCLVLISRVIEEHNRESKAGKIIAIVVSLFVGYELYVIPVYVKTAILVLSTAVLLFFEILHCREMKKAHCIIAVILSFAGALINFRVFFTTLIISIILLGIYILVHRKSLFHIRFVLLALLAVTVFTVVSEKIDDVLYEKNAAWSRACSYRDGIEELWLFGAPDYDIVREEILSNQDVYGYLMDIDANTYTNVINGFWGETEYYGDIIELARNICYEFTGWNIMKFFRTIPIKMFKTGMFYLMLIILVILYYGGAGKKVIKYFFVCEAMVFVPYFIDYWEKGNQTQVLGIIAYMPTIVYLLSKLRDFRVKDNRLMAVYMALTGLVLYYIFNGTFNGATLYANDISEIKELSEKEEKRLSFVDLNSYMRQYSSLVRYPSKIDQGDVYIVNSIYQMAYGYRDIKEVMKDSSYDKYEIISGADLTRHYLYCQIIEGKDLVDVSAENVFGGFHNLERYRVNIELQEEKEMPELMTADLLNFVGEDSTENFLILLDTVSFSASSLERLLEEKNFYASSISIMEEYGCNTKSFLSERYRFPIYVDGIVEKQIISPRYIVVGNDCYMEAAAVQLLSDFSTDFYKVYEIKDASKKIGFYDATLAADELIWFYGNDWNADQYINSGIDRNEGNFTWTKENEVVFKDIKLSGIDEKTDIFMCLEVGMVMDDSQRLIVLGEGKDDLFAESITEGGIYKIPLTTDENGEVRFKFLLPDAVSPKELGTGEDTRELGLLLRSISFER